MVKSRDGDTGPETAHVNELLSYALFHYDSATKAHLYDILIDFYTAGEISMARDSLWVAVGTRALGPKPERRQSTARDAHEAILDDIINALDVIDQDDCIDPPIFGAVNLDRLPRVSPVQDTQEATCARLSAIEAKIGQLCDAISTLQAPGPVPPPPTTVPDRTEIVPTSRPSNYATAAAAAKAPYHNSRKQITRNVRLSEMLQSTDHVPAASHSGSGFQYQRHDLKKQRRRTVIGSRTDGTLKGIEPSRRLFIYRLDKATTATELSNYLQQSVRVLKCDKISHDDARNSSFCVTVPMSDAEKMFSPDFWPFGVGCRNYIPPRTPTNG